LYFLSFLAFLKANSKFL